AVYYISPLIQNQDLRHGSNQQFYIGHPRACSDKLSTFGFLSILFHIVQSLTFAFLRSHRWSNWLVPTIQCTFVPCYKDWIVHVFLSPRFQVCLFENVPFFELESPRQKPYFYIHYLENQQL